MPPLPIVLVGTKFWNPLLDFLRNRSLGLGSIPADDLDSWHVVDSAEEAFELVKDSRDVDEKCDLSPKSFHCEQGIDWKVFRIMAELVEGFEFLTGLGNDVTVLGTKSIKPESEFYKAAYELGKRLAENKLAAITGGGPGTMEAVNKGAFEMGGESIGINMKYGYKERINPYVKRSIGFQFAFTRKLIITAPSKAFVFFPGGFGTLHQLFEVLTLIQTKKIKPMPIILYNKEFWQPMDDFIKKVMIEELKTISPEDQDLYTMVDSVDEIMKEIG